MAVQIQIRRGLASAWTAADPILSQGELGIELDTRKFKVGDGLTAWSSLSYVAARPEDVTSEINAAVASILGDAPAVLDTLGELSDAINDDPNFVSTVTTLSGDFTNHTSATTNVHGIADTSLLETQSGAQSKADAAQAAAEATASADATTKADAAEANANTYTDGEIATATSSLQSYADTAEADAISTAAADATSKANAAQAAAEATAAADATAKADAAEAAAKTYTDGQVSDLIQAAPGALDTLNELAAAINDDENFAATVATNLSNAVSNLEAYADQAEADAVSTAAADATSKADAAEGAANTYTDGEIATATSSLQAYADTAEADAVTTANAYTDGEIATATTALEAYADQAEIDAIASANSYTNTEIASATTSLQSYADTAEADAISAAAIDATAKADNAEAAANTYTDGEIATATTSLQAYADTAESDAISTAAADATSKADSAEAAAKSYSDSTFVPLTQKGAANGVPTLDGNSKIPSSQIPAVAIVDTFVVASEAAMLALTAEQGDVAIRTDLNKSFILSGSDPTLIADWQELLTPNDAVASVDGRTGTVSLSDLYDAAGSAAAAQSAAEATASADATTKANAAQSAAESYADSLAPNYDPAGSASAAQTAAETYADSLAVNYDPAGSASAAQSAAESYADSLASNYDPAGSASAAQSAAESYADSLASNYDAAGSAAAAQSAAEAYADQAEADAITTAAADATAKADAAEAAAKTYADNNFVPDSEKGAANGVATLDANSKIPSSQIPAVALTDTFVVASETAMLGLTAQTGDIAVRTDVNKTFVLSGTDASVVGDWQEMLTPTDAVQSVDGRTGTVTLSDLYDAAGSASSAQSAAESTASTALTNHNSATTNVHGIADTSDLVVTGDLNVYAPLDSPTFTGIPTAPTAAGGTNNTQVATTEYVLGELSSASIAKSQVEALSSSDVPTIDINAQSASYTLALADAGQLVEMGSASSQTLTVPTNASVAFPVGTKIDVLQTGAGECTIAGASGVTVNSEDGKSKINAQWQAATLVKRSTDAWVLVGAIKA